MQDHLTKFSLGITLKNHTANLIAQGFITKFECIHRIPDLILTDQGADFLSKI